MEFKELEKLKKIENLYKYVSNINSDNEEEIDNIKYGSYLGKVILDDLKNFVTSTIITTDDGLMLKREFSEDEIFEDYLFVKKISLEEYGLIIEFLSSLPISKFSIRLFMDRNYTCI